MPKRRIERLIAAGVFLLLAFPPAGRGAFAASPAEEASGRVRPLEEGMAAPGFSLPGIDGDPVSYAREGAGKPLLVIFFSVFCDLCRSEMPAVQRLHERYRDRGLAVAAVSVDGLPFREIVAGYVRQEGYTFRVAVDELDEDRYRVADLFGAAGIPAIYVIDKAGKVAMARTGRVRDEEMEGAVQAVLKR